jgi:hypothetical protein
MKEELNPEVVREGMRENQNEILRFAQVTNSDLSVATGAMCADMGYTLRFVAAKEHRNFMHSFVMPADVGSKRREAK